MRGPGVSTGPPDVVGAGAAVLGDEAGGVPGAPGPVFLEAGRAERRRVSRRATGARREPLHPDEGKGYRGGMPATRHAPGRRGNLLWGCAFEIHENPLRFVEALARDHGDLAWARLGWTDAFLASHPDDVRTILEVGMRRFPKGTAPLEAMRLLLGDGLVSAVGKAWARQRRVMQPVFRPEKIAPFARDVHELLAETVDEWGAAADRGQPVDVCASMTRLTLRVAGRALFSTNLGDDAPAFSEALGVMHDQTEDRILTPSPFPLWVPTPANREFRRALGILHGVVERVLGERRRRGPPADGDDQDLLDQLLAARDPETGEGFTDVELRDQVLTLLIAGHETTSNALAWALYLLARDPAVADAVAAEEAPPDEVPAPGSSPYLVDRCFLEALRLYPTTWILMRTCAEATTLRGYEVPVGAMVCVSAWLVHRHPDFWPDPEVFDPSRFVPEAEAERHRFAYIPWGAGPRVCIGAGLSRLEARVILRRLVGAFELELVDPEPVPPRPVVMLAPAREIQMRLRRRGDG